MSPFQYSFFLFPVLVFLASTPISTSFGQNVVFSDDFSTEDLGQWRFNDTPFENGAVSIDGGGIVDGALQLAITGITDFWGGFSLASERTFSATAANPLTIEVTRVSDEGVGTTRTGAWITDQTRSRYVFFSQNFGEGGWQYNRRIGEQGDNATGTGINIEAFDPLDDDGGSHLMKFVANGSTVQLFLDDQLGAEVDFPVTENIIFEFGAYTRAVGDEAVGTFDDVRVLSALPTGLPCVQISPAHVNLLSGAGATATITVPKLFLLDQGADITVSTADAGVATLEGANAAGEVVVRFQQGGENAKTVVIQAVGGGTTSIQLAAPDPLCVANSANVSVSSAFVRNPSFEDSPVPEPEPGYGAIGEWTGGSGVNDGGPFGDNGAIPDRSQIAFTQGSAGLTQEISGLDPSKQYFVQFFYNGRACCGGTIDMTVIFADQVLGAVTNVRPVGGLNPYHFFSASFQPGESTGILDISTQASGDATIVFDAVTIIQRDEGELIVANPSFEASGVPSGDGLISPAGLAGWTGTGNYGVNLSGPGPFADNGMTPDQDLVAFLQGTASLSQAIVGLVPETDYSLSFAVNARSGNSPNLVVQVDDEVLFDEAVAPVGDRNPYVVKTVGFQASAARHTLTFSQTAEGDQTVLLDDVKLAGEASNIPCVPIEISQFRATTTQEGTAFTLTIPEQAVADSPLNLVVSNTNPDGLALQGADEQGALRLTFEAGGELTVPVNFTARDVGTGMLTFAADKALCFTNEAVTYRVVSSPFRNPGFQSNAPWPFPTYGTIDDWAQSSNGGVNTVAGPFHDNGLIPDGAQVGFVQGSNSLQQVVAGLQPGVEHWLQFYYNMRICCGGTLSFQVLLDDVVLFEDPDVTPVGGQEPYYFAFVRFTPETTQGLFKIAVTTEGDASLTFDAFTIVPRTANDILVINPSFEMTGAYTLESPGYMAPASIGGWRATGGYGVNVSGEGPFADNGIAPSQDSAVFLQGAASSIAQTITGLTAGETYTLSYAYNARSNNAPQLRVTVDGETALDAAVTPVGGNNPYHMHTYEFVANGATAEIVFTQTAEGDHTVLLDDVRVISSMPVLPCIETGPAGLALNVGEMGTIAVEVPQALLDLHQIITVNITSSNPAAVHVVGDEALTFDSAGALEQMATIEAVGGGGALIQLAVEQEGICFTRDAIPVQVVRTIVRNGSFEENPVPAAPGYGAIEDWEGGNGIGLNNAQGPFHDNGLIPDRNQIAFLQGTTSIFQVLGNLEAQATYWLQLRYNRRELASEDTSMDFQVRLDAEEIARVAGVLPVGAGQPYHTLTIPFVTATNMPQLTISTQATGDATLLLDAISVIPRNAGGIALENASFEASGTPPAPGYLEQIAGWTFEGQGFGVNISGVGPFADNGTNPDQDYVLFLQGLTNGRQTVGKLVPGQTYTLSFSYNARIGNVPRLLVAIDGEAVLEQDVNPVGGAEPYHRAEIRFTPPGESIELAFGQVADGDQTVLIDAIRIVADDVVDPSALPRLSLALDETSARLFWQDTETAAVLQESPNLIDWEDSGEEVTLEDGINSATVARQESERYFRLRR